MKNNNAGNNVISPVIEKDRNWNKHRLSKTSVQVYLNDEEVAIVTRIKEQRRFSSYRELLVKLCQEEEERTQTSKPTKIKAEKKQKFIKKKENKKKHVMT